MPGVKRTRNQRLQDRAEVGRLSLEGWTNQEIADRITSSRSYSISRQQVEYDMRLNRREWLKTIIESRDDMVARELARIRLVERNAMNGWMRSLDDTVTKRVGAGRRPSGSNTPGSGQSSASSGQSSAAGPVNVTQTITTNAGNPTFLGVILQCVDRRCKILGLDAPVESKIEGVPAPIQIMSNEKGTVVVLPANGFEEAVARLKAEHDGKPIAVNDTSSTVGTTESVS